MDFDFTEKQQALQAEVRDFARNVIAKTVMERTREYRWDKDLWRELGRHKWPGVVVPTEYGGMGAGPIEHAIIVEEISKVDASLGAALNLIQQTIMAVLKFCTPAQKQKYLPGLSNGETYAMTGITESAAGSKLTDMSTTAVRDGDDWIINGIKTEVHVPEYVEACLIFAKAPGGISAFIVDTKNPGFKTLYAREIVGLRGNPMAAVGFENCRVPGENLLGKEGSYHEIFFNSFDLTRIGNAAKCIGIAEGALEAAIDYAKGRHVGDNVVTDFQGIRWQLADLVTRLEGARWLMHKAAMEYITTGRSTVNSAKAKLLACTTAMEATTVAFQITGSHGCFADQPFARFMMDAKLSEMTGGTVEILRNTIARDLLGKPTAPQP